jgi:hypothetical protein
MYHANHTATAIALVESSSNQTHPILPLSSNTNTLTHHHGKCYDTGHTHINPLCHPVALTSAWFTAAPASSRARTASACPLELAIYRGVAPLLWVTRTPQPEQTTGTAHPHAHSSPQNTLAPHTHYSTSLPAWLTPTLASSQPHSARPHTPWIDSLPRPHPAEPALPPRAHSDSPHTEGLLPHSAQPRVTQTTQQQPQPQPQPSLIFTYKPNTRPLAPLPHSKNKLQHHARESLLSTTPTHRGLVHCRALIQQSSHCLHVPILARHMQRRPTITLHSHVSHKPHKLRTNSCTHFSPIHKHAPRSRAQQPALHRPHSR